MMYRDTECEDVIDLSSDDEELPHADISNKETSNVLRHNKCSPPGLNLDHASRQEDFNQHNGSHEHERSFETPEAATSPHAAVNVYQNRMPGILDNQACLVKDDFSSLNDGVVQDLPNSVHSQQYTQSPFTNPAFPTNIQQKQISRRFWKAGDYEPHVIQSRAPPNGIDHVRVHPKFLHSNATSHKWALGAIAELLDNAIDEVQNGATYVRVDAVKNPQDGSPMLLVQDDGGGMDPDCMRQCMSLGYSRKTTNTTIGQYGNGFKTSTMRLGADVIVFSRCVQNGCVTESIGLLSYTFLRETGKEDIVVPMVDFELPSNSGTRKILLRATKDDWIQNLCMILQWSPYRTESELLNQFADICSRGTKIIVYNLWLNDDGELELDFDSNKKDIQLRGGPKPSKSDSLQKQFTSQHISNRLRYSLRAYSSILYLRMPERFQIILRGELVQHLSIAADLKFPEHILYKPQVGITKELGMGEVSVITTIGFAKEAPMINVHGFNVYHKNRLIMPFWKVFHENSSRGKGVVGVLEANFMEPAHDKQDFERTPVLQRLEGRLKSMTVEYWNLHCDLIGYQPPKHTFKAGINCTSTSTATPGYPSVQDASNQPRIHPPQAVIATGIPAHLLEVASHFSSHSSAFRSQNPFEFRASLGSTNGAGTQKTTKGTNWCHSDAMMDAKPVSSQMNAASTRQLHGLVADVSFKYPFKNPGIWSSAPSTPPQPGSDVEMLLKHADTTSDGCSNVANSFQSDCSESSLHTQGGINSGRVHQNMVGQEELVGKRLASEANLQTVDPASKRQVSPAMQGNTSSLSDLQQTGGIVAGNVGNMPPSSHGPSNAIDSLEEVEQLRLRCKQCQWEKQQLELKVLKLQQELLNAHYKLKMYETQNSADLKVESLE